MYLRRIKDYLLLAPKCSTTESLVLLTARVIFGFLFMSHGIAKWIMFKDFTEAFYDPIGLGATLSFWLVPIIFNMCIAVFVVHGTAPLNVVELALMYLTIFVLMFFTGPGEFSLDSIIRKMG